MNSGNWTTAGRPQSFSADLEQQDFSHHLPLCRLFVGCLPSAVTAAELRSIFEVYGNVLELKVFEEQTGESLHFAFVQFEFVASYEAAVAGLHCFYYCGDMSIPMQVRVLFLAPQTGTVSVLVSGFPRTSTCSPQELQRHFQMQYGPVAEVVFSGDHELVVKFNYRSSAEQFIHDAFMNALYLPTGEFVQSPVKAVLADQTQFLSHKDRVLRLDGERDRDSGQPVKLFVGCLPYSKTAAEVATVFGQFGPLLEVAVLTDIDGRSKGAAFVTFANKDHAEIALARLAGFVFPGSTRPINVSLAHKQQCCLPATYYVAPQPYYT